MQNNTEFSIVPDEQEYQARDGSDIAVADFFSTACGAINERIAYKLPKIIENLIDPNTDPKKARKLSVNVTFSANVNRTLISAKISVTHKLVATDDISAQYVIFGDSENAGLLEFSPQIPGQQDLYGNEQAQPKVVKTIK